MFRGPPVLYSSRVITATERNYAQVEKDLLAIVFAAGKFDQCIYARNVQVIKFQDVEATELSVSPERLQAIKAATASDTVFQSLSEVVKQGWPEERSKLKSELYHFFQIRQGRSQAFFGSTHKVRMILNCTDHSQKY